MSEHHALNLKREHAMPRSAVPKAARARDETYLPPEERDIAATLASYHRKIVEMRQPSELTGEGLAAAVETQASQPSL